jgi:peptidase E
MKLLLTSNGLSDPSLEKAFLEMTNYRTDLKMAWIGTAGDPIEWVPDGVDKKSFTAKLIPEKLEQQEAWWNRYREKWEAKGYRVINADLKEDPAVLKEKLQSVDIINVGGGDVNYLLDWAKKSQLDSYLKELLDRGVVYM